MSGGALDYAYLRVQDIAVEINKKSRCLEHRALANHLLRISDVLRDVEWVMSGDSGEGDDVQAIRNLLSPAEILGTARSDAIQALKDLKSAIRASVNPRISRIDIIGQNGNDGDHYAELEGKGVSR